jgi:molecular chaperone GrpE
VTGDFGPGWSEVEDVAEGEVVGEETFDSPPEEPGEGEANDDALPTVELSPIEVLALERDEYLDALRRLQAEFDNFRKRTARQQSDLLDRATESLLERLLPVLDALDLAVAHTSSDDAETNQLTGLLVQIGTLLRDTLVREGLEQIAETGVDFDPTIHDAVASIPAEDGEEGADGRHLVDDVLRPGYRLKGRVLRPAMVRVRG